jgi:hypothetical protein
MNAVLAGNQLLNFNNHGGVAGDLKAFVFDGDAWLDLPAFRAPKIAGGRNLQVKGRILSRSDSGVIFAHGGAENGYSVYLESGKLCFAACANGRRVVVASPNPITESFDFEASWSSRGDMFLKVNKKLVGKAKTRALIQKEPADSIQIGADLGESVGAYRSPSLFEGTIENLVFKYPNGS